MYKEYYILEEDFYKFEKKVTKIRNKCLKFGNSFHYEKIREEIKSIKIGFDKEIFLNFVVIECEATAIINGWKFLAKIEHEEERNKVFSFDPDFCIKDYIHTKGKCDHCKTNRYRKNTFLIKNIETNQIMQVGKSCLSNFIGVSLEDYASYLDALAKLIGQVSDKDFSEFDTNKIKDRYLPTNKYLINVLMVNKIFGYRKKENENCTAKLAFCLLSDKKFITEIQKLDTTITKEALEPSEDDINYLNKVISWFKDSDFEDTCYNTFLINLQSLLFNDYNRLKDRYFLACLFSVYERNVERIRKEEVMKAKLETQEFVGAIGDKIVFDGIMTIVTSFDTEWGTSYVYKIIDSNNKIFIWKTTKRFDTNDTKIINIKGTIKEHNTFRGEKQTILTRCKIS